jgi:hypothetical protein
LALGTTGNPQPGLFIGQGIPGEKNELIPAVQVPSTIKFPAGPKYRLSHLRSRRRDGWSEGEREHLS